MKIKQYMSILLLGMGLTMLPNIKTSAQVVSKDINVDIKNEKFIIKDKTIFFTDKKITKTSIPDKQYWYRAELEDLDNDSKLNDSVIDFAFSNAATTIYMSDTPTPKQSDIIGIHIPARPTFTAKINNRASEELFTSGDEGFFIFKVGSGRNAEIVDVSEIQVKKTSSSKWIKFSDFFGNNTEELNMLMKSGDTIFVRLAPQVTGSSITLKSYTDESNTISNKYTFSNRRASIYKSLKLPKRAAAPSVSLNMSNYIITLSKSQEYAVLDSLNIKESDIGWNDVAEMTEGKKYKESFQELFSDETTNNIYYAVRTKAINTTKKKVPASQINYITIKQRESMTTNNISVEGNKKDGVKITLTGNPNDCYEYIIVEDDDTALISKWKTVKIPSNSTNAIINIKARDLKEDKNIYIRKQGNINLAQPASAWIKYTPPEDDTQDWTSETNGKDIDKPILSAKNDIKVTSDEAKTIFTITLSESVSYVDSAVAADNIEIYFNGMRLLKFPISDESISIDDNVITIVSSGTYDNGVLVKVKIKEGVLSDEAGNVNDVLETKNFEIGS